MHVGKEKKFETLEIENWKLEKEKENNETTLKATHVGKMSIDTVKSNHFLGNVSK